MKQLLLSIGVSVLLFVSILSVAVAMNNDVEGSSIALDNGGNGWNQTFGGSSYDEGYSVQQTNDGGYIIAGCTVSYGAGDWDVWLIKTDSSGNEDWNSTFGGSSYDEGYSVQQTNDGGYIIAGCTHSYGEGEFDVWLIKTDSSGNEDWNSTFGGSNVDWGYSVQQTNDGGYIIGGYTDSYGAGDLDVWLIKTDSNGNEEWNSTFGGSSYDRGFSVQQTNDDGYIITGYTVSYDADDTGCDVLLVKTDSNGIKEWHQTFGGTGIPNKFDMGYSVQQTNDGGYIIAGDTERYFVAKSDFLLIKTDSNGNEEWSRTFGGSAADRGRSVKQTNDGGYIIAGWASSFGEGNPDFWLIKTDSSGNEDWNYTFGFGEDSGDWGYSVQQTNDGGYIIAGATMPDGWITTGSTASYTAEGTDVWLIKINASDNRPPETPGAPQGPSQGAPGEVYDFIANTTDPDNDTIAYMFDWGDGNFSDWTDFVSSGTEVYVSYGWDDKGSYDVRVKAKDIHGEESPSWSPPHTIIIEEYDLQIKSVEGGIGITAVIENVGDANVTDIEWHIFVEGGLLNLIDVDANDTETELEADDELTVQTGSLGLFHLGGIKITVIVEANNVDKVTKEETGFVLGPFVIIR